MATVQMNLSQSKVYIVVKNSPTRLFVLAIYNININILTSNFFCNLSSLIYKKMRPQHVRLRVLSESPNPLFDSPPSIILPN